ncbi:MAG TPA: DUF4041 domain-containing protein [Gemmatimonadaceae bacterium]|jgi:hypothetical protein
MPVSIILYVLLSVAILAIVFLVARLSSAAADRRELEQRFKPVLDVEAERARVATELATERSRQAAETVTQREALDRSRREAEQARSTAAEELQELTMRRDALRSEVAAMDEQATMQSFGVYHRVFDFATSADFDKLIAGLEADQASMIKSGRAAVCTTEWSVEGSKKKGEQMTKRNLNLMLRAFNGECDAAIAKVRYNNIHVMETRIWKAAEAINKLGLVNQCHIANPYVEVRLTELRAIHEQRERIQAEKEEQRQIREQMREEELALREMEKARQEAERDEARYVAALEKARQEAELAQGAKQAKLAERIAEMERLLAEAHANKERAIARAQMTRSGHVYVISNIGSFGEHVYKIGMTRRLDPMDRIRELGDASVPFEFDVHAIIYADDAPRLEADLHRVFDQRRVNLVNARKEFFFVDIQEIEREVRQRHADILLTRVARAEEYRKSAAISAERGDDTRGWGTYDRRASTATVGVD